MYSKSQRDSEVQATRKTFNKKMYSTCMSVYSSKGVTSNQLKPEKLMANAQESRDWEGLHHAQITPKVRKFRIQKLLTGPSMRPSRVMGDKHFNLCINFVIRQITT